MIKILKNEDAKKYYFLPEVTEEIASLAGDAGSKLGTGGMKSKIDAAKTALSLGVSVFIGTGRGQEKFVDVLKGKVTERMSEMPLKKK